MVNSSSVNSGDEPHGLNVLVPVSPSPDSGEETMYRVGARLLTRGSSLAGYDSAGAILAQFDIADTGEQPTDDDCLSYLWSGICIGGIGGNLLILGPETMSLLVLILKGGTASRPRGRFVPELVSVSASSSPSMTPSSSRIRWTLGIPLTSSTGDPAQLWPLSDREYSSISPVVRAA